MPGQETNIPQAMWCGLKEKNLKRTGDFPNPGIKPRSPALQVDSLPAEPPGKPKSTEWVAYPFSRGSSWPRNRTRASWVAGRFFTNWAIREALLPHKKEQAVYNLLKAEEQSQDSWYSGIYVPKLPPWSQVVTFRRAQMSHIKPWGHYTKISFLFL